jgi:hypothetical protein
VSPWSTIEIACTTRVVTGLVLFFRLSRASEADEYAKRLEEVASKISASAADKAEEADKWKSLVVAEPEGGEVGEEGVEPAGEGGEEEGGAK